MHSSRMRKVRCSSRLLAEGVVSGWGGVCPGGVWPGGLWCLARGVSVQGGVVSGQGDVHLPSVVRILDTRL